jgi:hypothetical protein
LQGVCVQAKGIHIRYKKRIGREVLGRRREVVKDGHELVLIRYERKNMKTAHKLTRPSLSFSPLYSCTPLSGLEYDNFSISRDDAIEQHSAEPT